MECMYGKQRHEIDAAALAARAATYPYCWIDLGTGDGRYVSYLATALPRWLVVGVDTCREQLRERSRVARPNAVFAVANALNLPPELDGLANRVSINFPWGSLLRGLIAGDPGLLGGLERIGRPDLLLDLRLNDGALAELGLSAIEAAARLREVLGAAGWRCAAPVRLEARHLRGLATTWAHRLAFGPAPRAVGLRAVRLVPAGERSGWPQPAEKKQC